MKLQKRQNPDHTKLRVEFDYDYDFVKELPCYRVQFRCADGELFVAQEHSIAELIKGMETVLTLHFMLVSTGQEIVEE